MKQKEIKLSKRKLILLLLASIWFITISSAFILYPERFISFIFFNEKIIKNIGFIGLPFFGLASLLLVKKMFDNKPGLIINEKGITDNSNSSSIGLIKWSDITEISLGRVMSTQFLLIKVSNPEDYIQKANQMKKLLLKQNLKTYGTPITITSVGLQCSFEDLEQMILESYNQNR
ncbi:hypothetical protein NJT12_15880 [Flavobacterium sp. AC]|uniref:Uncharacterized protein n=1 Tax=Flavobacterium azizsancarii TaxID=2961580 RepID=A0ABT4WG80_9FLAO|nr:STM3941 family protein [Flavobacterium azizsancarii]MDA6071095.1 hypothetical protein [Flavobacterium azizsancarii]